MITKASSETQTPAPEAQTFDVVVDCGNANVKATLVKGASVLQTIKFPSRIRFTNVYEVHMAWAGYTLGTQSVLVGNNCGDRGDTVVVGDDSQGKLKHLKYLLGGVCSAFVGKLPIGSHLRFHILTLSTDVKKQVEAAVQSLTELQVDGVERKYTVELGQLLPEGAGCSFYVASAFKNAKALTVLDIGSGTMNLSSYTIIDKAPLRTSFEFEGVGIRQYKNELYSFIKRATTNGHVNKTYVEYALVENSYRLMDGIDISKPLAQAVESWANSPEVKGMLTKARHILATGGYVGCCGGGWKIQLVREALVKELLGEEPTDELKARLLVPEEADVLGVLGVAKSITKAARNLQKKNQKKKGKTNDERQQTSEQHAEGFVAPVEPVSSDSTGEQPTTGGATEQGTGGMGEPTELTTHTEEANSTTEGE